MRLRLHKRVHRLQEQIRPVVVCASVLFLSPSHSEVTLFELLRGLAAHACKYSSRRSSTGHIITQSLINTCQVLLQKPSLTVSSSAGNRWTPWLVTGDKTTLKSIVG